MGAKRGNGEGTIYRDEKTGRWIGQAAIQGKRKSLYGKTRKEVQDKLRVLLADADKGLLPPSERLTVAQFLQRWLEGVVKPGLRSTTYRDYKNTIDRHTVPLLGHLRLTQLQPAHLQGLYASLLDSGLSPKTVRNVHGCIHAALEQAVKWNLAARNVSSIVELPRVRRHEIQALTTEQVKVLFATAQGSRWETLLMLAIASAMRQSELLALKWSDVDLESGQIHIRRQLDRDKTFSEPKTAKGRRTVDLPASTVVALREHRTRQLQDRLLMGAEWEDIDLVFCTHQGRPLGHRNVIREYTKLLQRAGIPHVEFHALRHTGATMLLLQGVNPKVVQERLGHSQISVTLDIYSHVVPSLGRDAADRLDKLLA